MKEVRVGPHAVSGGLQSRDRSPEGGGILLPDSRPPRQLLPGSPGCPPALQILTHSPPTLREPIPENRSLCLLLSLFLWRPRTKAASRARRPLFGWQLFDSKGTPQICLAFGGGEKGSL